MSSGGEIDDEGQDKYKNSDHVRPIYLANTEVFAYDERKTKGWVALAPTKVPTSIAFDDTRGGIHRIIAVDEEGHKVILNSTVSSSLEFHKTSDKFGHWTDQTTGTIYGIGFVSDYEQQQFMTILERCRASQQCRECSSYQIPPPSRSKGTVYNPHCVENMSKGYRVPPPPTQLQEKPEISFIMPPHRSQSKECGDHSKVKGSLEDLRVKAPRNQVRLITCASSGEESYAEKVPAKPTTVGHSKMSVTENKEPDSEKKKHMNETIKSLHKENSELKKTLEKSAEQVRMWEKEMEDLKIKNGQLVRQVESKATEVEECKKAGFALQQEVGRLKDAERSNEHKLKNAEALEQRLESLKEEKRTLENTVTTLTAEEETNKLRSESTTNLDCTQSEFEFSREAAALEEHYKKVLKSVESQVEEAQKAKTDGQVYLAKLGPTFLQTIHELISIHGQIKVAYQQQQKVLEVSQQPQSSPPFPQSTTQPNNNSWSTSYKF